MTLGHWGFSWTGLLFLALLMAPNLLWTKNKPKGYSAAGEDRRLLALERIGEAGTVCTALVFRDTNPGPWSAWSLWLAAAALLMLLYECWWARFFKSGKQLSDFYSSFLGVPLAGATLPVAAFGLLGVYGRLLPLLFFTLVLGVGHIGIHLQHYRALARGRG